MATRQLGFKLVVIGNDKTISDLDKVGKKLDEVAKKISDIQNQPIKLSTTYDTKGLNVLLKTLDKVDKTKLNPQIVNTIKELKTQLSGLDKQVNGTQEKLNKVKAPELNEVQVEKINSSFRKLNGSAEEVVATIATLKPKLSDIGTQEALQLANAIAKVQQNLEKVKSQKLEIKSDKTVTDSVKADLLAPLIAQEKELQQQQKELNKSIDLTTRAFVQQANAVPKDSIVGLQLELAKLTKQYNLLGKAELESAQGQQLQSKIAGVTNEISDREQAVGNFRRNVGNYQSAIQGLIPKLEELQKEGILAQKELGDIFKGDLIRREQELRAELEKLVNEFKELGSEIANAGKRAAVLGTIDEKVRELAATRGTIESMGTSFKRMGQKLASVSDIITGGLIGGGIIATIGALTSFARGSLTEFTQAETAVAKINQQLKITGGLSGQSAEGLENMAKELEVLTGIGGGQILNDVTSGLLKFTRIQGQVFQDAQKAAIDLSTVLGGDLSGATQLLGKALENPIKGITQLQKAGISLDTSAQKQIKTAIEQNDLYKAQSILLTEVNKRFGGLATAVNNTDLQGLRRLTVGFNNFKEAVGKGLVQAGNSIVQFFSDIALGVNVFDESTRTMERGLRTLEQAVSDEVSNIKSVTNALKDESLSREGRNALIQELINKYPGLIDQYDLEYASIGRLDEIQKELTQTVVKQVADRIKAQTKEALISKQIAKSIEIAQLKAGRLSTSERFVAGLQGGSQDQAVQKFITEKETQIKELQTQINDVDKTFAQYDVTLKNALGLPLTEQAGISSNEKLNTRIRAVIGETAKVLQDEKASKQAKAYALRLQTEFQGIEKQIQKGGQTEDQRLALIKKSEAGLSELAALSKKRLDLTKESDAAQTKNQEDAAKALQDQLKRIEDLKRRIQDLNIDAIPNEFDQKIEEVKANTKRQVDDIQKDLDSLRLKPIKTDKDLIEIEETQRLIEALEAAGQAAQTKINIERKKVLDAATKELENTRQEVLQIIADINQVEIDVQIDDAKFNLEQAERKIQIEFQANVDELTKQLEAGLIEQEDFNKQSAILEAQKLDDIADLYTGFETEQSGRLKRQFEAELDYNKKVYQAKRQNIQDQLQLDLLEINSDLRAGRIDPIEATELRAEKIKLATAEIGKVDQEYANEKLKLERGLTNNLNQLTDAQTEAHRRAEQAQTQTTSDEAKKRAEKRKQEFEEAARIGFALAQSISDSLFEIEEANNEKAFESQRQRIEKNYENQIKAAQGNTAEVERLEREKAQKIDQLDKQQSEKRKKAAINKAIIDSSLAIIKAFSELGPIAGAVAAIFIGAQTAIQINKIKRTTFAKGGRVGGFTGGSIAPPDETGERPVDAQLHYGEFVSTRKQVNKNQWLYDILDADRKRTNAGASTDLEQQLADRILLRRRAVYNLSTPTRRRFEPVIPVVIPMGSSVKSELEITDEQIERMAEIMAEKIATKSGLAIFEGSTEGIKHATKEALRSERTNLRKVI